MASGNAEKALCPNKKKKGNKVKQRQNPMEMISTIDGDSCPDKKIGKKVQKRHNPKKMIGTIDGDSCRKKNGGVDSELELKRVQRIFSIASLETCLHLEVGKDCSSKADSEGTQSNVNLGQSKTQKRRKNRSRKSTKNAHIDAGGNNPTEKISSIEGNSCFEKNIGVNSELELQRAQCIFSNASLETDTFSEVGNNCSSNAYLERTQSNVNLGQLETRKERRKRKEKRESMKNARIDAEGNSPVEMIGSIEGDSCLETNVGLKLEAELHRVQFSELNCSKSLDTLENSKRSTEVNDSELVGNKLENVEIVQAVALAKVVENLSIKKTSASCSNGESLNEERNKLVEMKNDNHKDVPIKENKDAQTLQLSLEPHAVCVKKKLLILDINGLLADIVAYAPGCYKADIIVSKKSVFKRPFCDDFLQFCFEKFNVGVWSSRTKRNLNLLIDFLLGDSKRNLLFCWDQSHCTETGFTTVENTSKPLLLKELKKLWDKRDPCLPWNIGDYNESNTLLLDDSPYKALCNPIYTGVFPHSYQYQQIRDSSLGPTGDLRMYLERLAEAPNVPDYVAQNPYGQRAITERNPSWSFYQGIINNRSRHS